jgi:hypothetical protein
MASTGRPTRPPALLMNFQIDGLGTGNWMTEQLPAGDKRVALCEYNFFVV